MLESSELAAAENQFLRLRSWAAGDATLGRNACLADRVTTTVAATFTTTQRMVDRVHGLGPGVRADAHVTAAAGFAEADVDPIGVAELADRRPALALHSTHFAGWKNDDGILTLLRAEATDAAGRANKLAALAGIQFDVVNFQADGDVRERNAIADFRRRIRAADDLRADGQAERAEDVALFAIFVLDQGDENGAIGIVFDRFDVRGDVVFLPLEIDQAIQTLVAAAA